MRKFLNLILAIAFLPAACQTKKDTDFETQKKFQIELNQKVLDALKKSGESFTKARPVFHWIYFKTEEDEKKYLKEVETHKFVLVSTNKIVRELPYELKIKRIDLVDKKSVDDYALYLWEQSLKYNGYYDGWETSVEKN
ncbi:MAG: ribonuclease E inhibitor RraB [Flavobacterium sp.]